ncbi:hypothetical protein AB4Y43_01555 [Paraburkholderia sp. BR10872]|uniref:hypothetical protein n=1 Tax=Paraburkholderia sp. BR10872 TaxID=3236989 RepID=UPI0034D3214E
MSDKVQVSIGFLGLPATTPFRGSIEGNFAPAPSSAETLRQIAANLQGDDPMRVVFAGILLKAAAELDARMTDDEAREILRGGSAWIDWDDSGNRPDWAHCDSIRLDGEFTAKELLAILHFAPKDKS